MIMGGCRAVAIAAFGSILYGCASVPASEPVAAPAAAEQRTSGAAATVPAPGASAPIHDVGAGELKLVRFGKSYMAASGKRCAYYYDPGHGNAPSGIACQDQAGGWYRSSPRIPVTRGP
jgi:hypothetical protein